MPGADENLRFTTELKDLFTESWEKIVDHVKEGREKITENLDAVTEKATSSAETITSKMGGLGKTLGVVAAVVAVGGAAYEGWTKFKNLIVTATAESERLEKTLGNILGSSGKAQAALQEIANSSLAKTFGLKDLDEGYANLADHSLRLSEKQLQGIGDLGANTGRQFNQAAEAIIKGGEGRFEQLKSIGVEVVKHHETVNKKLHGLTIGAGGLKGSTEKVKEKIDEVTFSFRGQEKTVKNNEAAIRQYLLTLGTLEGVQGSAEKMQDTITAKQAAYANQVDLLKDALAERFRPEVKANISMMTKWVSTIRAWIEIPVEKKINEEISKIGTLQAELTSSNTKEERRKQILLELKDLNPKITDGISAEKIEYGKLAENIDKVLGGLRDKIVLEQLSKEYNKDISNYYEQQERLEKRKQGLRSKAFDLYPGIATGTGLTDSEKFALIGQQIQSKKDAYYKQHPDKRGYVDPLNDDERALLNANNDIKRQENVVNELLPAYQKFLNKKNFLTGKIDEALGKGLDTSTDKPSPDKPNKREIDTAGLGSVSGGGQIKNINISIGNLIGGNVQMYATTIKQTAKQAGDIVVEGLLTAVNDANLIGN